MASRCLIISIRSISDRPSRRTLRSLKQNDRSLTAICANADDCAASAGHREQLFGALA
mgnify:CR=1 FL=1